MTEKNKLSRKSFIKNCSATVGLMSLGLGAFAKENVDEESFYKNTSKKVLKESSTKIRGSWVRKGEILPGDIPLKNCEIVVEDNQPTAVKQAALFLADDIYKISGYRPTISKKPTAGKVNIILKTVDDAGIPAETRPETLKEKEAFQILTKDNNVWLIGADFRGTAYAVYTLSERLGIDPLYLWTGYTPTKNPELILKNTNYFAPAPTFKYRGFFHDDEDVLPRPFDKYGYPLRIGDVPLEWYQRFFETALRLKMNMVAPYVRVHRRYEVQKCASDWGLYFTSHHYDILLSNPFGIERFFLADKRDVSIDWDWFKNKQNMIKYWRGGVEENKDINAIWPVGLRGTDDHAYEFPKDVTEKEQADVFRAAIDEQVKTVKDLVQNKNEAPVFHFTLYTEMLEKYRNHPEIFNVPEEVILVWPDNNDGVMRDLPTGKDKWKHGVYYHLAYYGGAPTKQGPHIVSPKRVTEQFKKIVDANATEFMLVNVSELREFVMEARLIGDICWDANAVLNRPQPDEDYLQWWAKEYFENGKTDEIVSVYKDYYQILNSSEKYYAGAILFEEVLDELHKKFSRLNYKMLVLSKIDAIKQRISEYESVFAKIEKIKKDLAMEEKQFFFEHVELGLRMDQRPTQAAVLLLDALKQDNHSKAWNLVAEAMVPLEKLELEILRAERPPFEKWFEPTWIKTLISPLNFHRSYTQLRDFINNGGLISPIKKKVALGHNIEGARLWTDYLEGADKINPSY